MDATMSIVLNQYESGWQFVIVNQNGAMLQTSPREYESAAIALSHAQMWLDRHPEKS